MQFAIQATQQPMTDESNDILKMQKSSWETTLNWKATASSKKQKVYLAHFQA